MPAYIIVTNYEKLSFILIILKTIDLSTVSLNIWNEYYTNFLVPKLYQAELISQILITYENFTLGELLELPQSCLAHL